MVGPPDQYRSRVPGETLASGGVVKPRLGMEIAPGKPALVVGQQQFEPFPRQLALNGLADQHLP